MKLHASLRFGAAALLGVLLSASAWAAKPGWLEDYDAAKKKAKEEKKLLLIDFTGSDWCGWCIKLDKEIFSKKEFNDFAKENLVLLEVDFPQKSSQSAKQKKANKELAAEYKIEGYPTLIILDADGKKVGELGYMKGGPAAMIAELKKLKKS